MIGSLIPGIKEAKGAILAGSLAVAICLPVGYCSGRQAERNRANAERLLANVEAQKKSATAAENAAVRRVDDALRVAEQEKGLTDAIQETPDTAPDAVRVGLGCERLRRQGADPNDLPAACRPEGGFQPQAPRTR